jgi:hypothetical protein
VVTPRETNADLARRLEVIEKKLDRLTSEVDQAKGALFLAKLVLAFLSVSGVGALLTWVQGQGK